MKMSLTHSICFDIFEMVIYYCQLCEGWRNAGAESRRMGRCWTLEVIRPEMKPFRKPAHHLWADLISVMERPSRLAVKRVRQLFVG